MEAAKSPLFSFISRLVAQVYLVCCLSPAQFGVPSESLPKFSFGPELAFADGDVSNQTFGAALSVGRSVRRKDAGGSTIEVRYAVSNTGRDPISGARLGLTLLPGVSLDFATPEASRNGQELSFSIGELPARSVREITLELTHPGGGTGPLDSGATVFASIDGIPVSYSTLPASVTPIVGDSTLYAATLDANSDDPYIIAQAGKLDHDPNRIFAFVRDNIRNEVYSGSLRGARGTLLGGAGNSLDKSSLLIALLRASGVPSRYVQGTLDDSTAKLLILSMFPAALNVVGYIAAGDETADPANDPALLFDAKPHTWVEFDPNQSGFQAADASFANAQLGNTFAAASLTFASVPDNQRHKVTLRVKAETTTPSLLGGSFSSEAPVLEATFASVELVGRPLHLQHQVNGSSAPVPAFSYSSFNYSPFLLFDRTDGATSDEDVIRGTDYQEVLTSFPFGSQILTGVFLDIETTAPNGIVTASRKTVLDRIGFDVRQNGGAPSIGNTGQPALSAFDVTTIYISTGNVPDEFGARRSAQVLEAQSNLAAYKPQLDALLASSPASLSPAQQAFVTNTREAQLASLRLLGTFVAERFLGISSTLNKPTESASYARIYADVPRSIVVTQRSTLNGNQVTASLNLDLLKDGARIVLAKGQSTSAIVLAGLQRGISENVAETSAAQIPGLPAPISTISILQAAQAQNIPTTYLVPTNIALLDGLSISAQAKARISQALAANKLVLVPSSMVTINGKQTIGWYETDGVTGETLALLEDGTHSGSIEWGAVLSAIFDGGILISLFFYLGFFGGYAAVFLPGLVSAILVLNDKDVKPQWEQNLDTVGQLVGLGGLVPGGYPSIGDIIPKSIDVVAKFFNKIKAFLAIPVGAALVAGFALGIELAIASLKFFVSVYDPIVQGFLMGANDPINPPNVATTDVSVTASLPSGAVQASQQTGFTEIRGQMDSTWNGQLDLAAAVSALNAGTATVLTFDGQPVGTGTVSVSGNTAVDTHIGISGSLNVSGNGAMTFYGPSTPLLGSAASWKQFSASASGTTSLSFTATNRISLNGSLLPLGNYRVQSSSLTFSGSGAGLSVNYLANVSASAAAAAVHIGSGAGNVTLAGVPADTSNGFALSSYSGTVSIAASGNTDTVSLNGTASQAALLSIPTSAVSADQNSAATVEPAILSSLTGDFSLTARAPPGWTVAFTPDKKLQITPKGGLQSGIVPVYLSAISKADPALVASAKIDLTIGATAPGVDLGIAPEPALVVNELGANIPSAFKAQIKNLGPVRDTFTLAVSQAPAGFEARLSTSSLSVAPGYRGEVGVYLIPTAPLPPPGTSITFGLTATSVSNGAITDTATGVFLVPEIHALGVAFDPPSVTAPPGSSIGTALTVSNHGNVGEPNIQLSFLAPGDLNVSAPSSPLSLAIGGSSTQTITLTPASSVPLNSSIGAKLTVTYGNPASLLTIPSGVGVEVAIPGAGAANDAAAEAALAGDAELSQGLRALGISLTALFLNPNDPIQQGLALANISNLISLLGSDEFADIRAQLQAIYDAIASGNTAAILAALDALTAILNSITQVTAASRAHNFKMYLLPTTQVALPSIPTIFGVALQNVGTKSTTIELSVGALPAGVTGSVSNSPITLAPGQTSQLPSVTITNSGTNLVPFEFSVIGHVTDADGAGLTHSTQGAFTSRLESVQIYGIAPTPAFVTPGFPVSISARVIAALNSPRTLKFFYDVQDGSSSTLFTSTAVQQSFGTDNALQSVLLPDFDSSGLGNGPYTVHVRVTEEDGTPIQGSEGIGGFFVGSPVLSSLYITPDQVPPGDSTVTANLYVQSLTGLGTGLELLGQTDVFGARGDFAIKDGKAYIAGGTLGSGVLGTSATIADISDPSHPVALSQFATGPSAAISLGGSSSDKLIVGGQVQESDNVNADSTIRVFSLANPLSPNELTASPLILTRRQYFNGLYPHGDRIYSIHSGYRFFLFSNVFNHWGGVSVLDVSNGATPNFSGSFYNGSKTDPVDTRIVAEGVAEGWAGAIVDVSDTVVYHLANNAPQNNPDAGPGVVRIFNLTNPASPVLDHELVIPGTAQVLSGHRNGNQVLLVSATGGITSAVNVNGHLVLTVLDITDPLHPVISAQSDLPDYDPDFLTRPLPTGSGKWIIGDNLFRATDGLNVFGFADTSTPGTIKISSVPSFPGATSYQFHVDGNNLLVVDASGLKIFSLGSLAQTTVTASVDVPKNTGISIVPGSFSVSPSSIVDNGTFNTIVWNADKFPVPYEPFNTTITWQLGVSGMKAVEAREALNGGKVNFTYTGAAGEVPLDAAFVQSGFTLFLDPASQGTAPGGQAFYNVQVVNAVGPNQTYALSVVGIDPDWVSLPAQVTVTSGSSEIVPLILSPDINASETEYTFTVLATPVGQTSDFAGSVRGSLVVSGDAIRPDGIAHGIVVQLIPTTATAGQAVPAQFRVRLTNTGLAKEFYALSANAPGLNGTFGNTFVEVPPGVSNFRETTLELTPAVGVVSGSRPFTVTAVSTLDPDVNASADGTVNVIGQGVGAFFTPATGSPGSQLTLTVVNSGTATDTFTLGLAGPAGPFSNLSQQTVTLASGASANIPVTVGSISFDRPGALDLLATAVSQTNAAARAVARAEVSVPVRKTFGVHFEPPLVTLNSPGGADYFVTIENTGNTDDLYSLEIVSVTADGNAHLMDSNGDPSTKITGFRIPGGSKGGYLVKAAKPTFGESDFVVKVVSLEQDTGSNIATGVLVVNDPNDLCPNDPAKSAPGICGCGVADLDSDGDGTYNCQDGCVSDPGKTAAGVCGCGVADSDTNANGIFDCRECKGTCSQSAPLFDEDGDGVPNCEEISEQTDACDSGSFVPELQPLACAGANGFLSQINIATVLNQLATPLFVIVEYRDAAGVKQGEVSFELASRLKRDIIVNDLGLKPDTYGTLCVYTNATVQGAWSGGLSIYKPRIENGVPAQWGESQSLDFALYYPFANPQTGASSFSLNTNSIGTDGRGTVANWVRVLDAVNGDGRGVDGTLNYYDIAGKLAASEPVHLGDGSRFDYPAHQRLGNNQVGLVQFVPDSLSLEYYMEVTRYFYEGSGATSPNFYTAFALPRRPLTGAKVTGRAAVKPGELHVVEIVNGSDDESAVNVASFDVSGNQVGAINTTLNAKGSFHHVVVANNTSSTFASAEVSGDKESLGTISVVYSFDSAGRLQYAYAPQFAESAGSVQFSEFNSFLGHTNSLEVFNSTNANISGTVAVTTFDSNVTDSFNFDIPARGTLERLLNVPKDSYGTVVVDSGSNIGLIVRNNVTRPGQYVLPFFGQ